MADNECDIGMVGAGTMGGNPALNFADKTAVELGLLGKVLHTVWKKTEGNT